MNTQYSILTATVLSKKGKLNNWYEITNKLCDAIPEDCWHHDLQKITRWLQSCLKALQDQFWLSQLIFS